MASHFSLSAVSLITLLFLAATASVTYSTSTIATYPTPPLPERVTSTVTSFGLAALRLDVSDPNLVRAFLYSNTTLLLTIPDALVPPLATNRTNALWWLYSLLGFNLNRCGCSSRTMFLSLGVQSRFWILLIQLSVVFKMISYFGNLFLSILKL
ncbi:hypothetical protein ACLB2K_035515 [Fragaria x ananassa]